MSDDHFSTFQITPEDQQAFVSVSISYEEFKEGLFVCFRDNVAFSKQLKGPFESFFSGLFKIQNLN